MKVEIIDITDRSGSMSTLRADVIGGFNVFLHDQKEAPGQAKMTHVQFDDVYEVLYAGVPVQDVQPLTTETYVPRGCTALLDAIGRTLDIQGKRIKDENWADKIIVCIRTDGQENASKEYSQQRIKQMIQHAQDHGWVFIFAAANQDAFVTGATYGIAAGTTMDWCPTDAGTSASYASTSATVRSLRADPNDVLPLQALLNSAK